MSSRSDPSFGSSKKWPAWASVLLLALLLTAINASKPICYDDWTYYTFAREFLSHPANPYHFVYGLPVPYPANATLVPPVLPAWLAVGMSLLSDDPVVLRFWLFPFAWLLAWAMSALLRQFAPAIAEPVLWLTMLSPGILTGFNFMLEVPVLSLQLAALVLAMKACHEGRWTLIFAAGLVAGLALQTKYTAFAAVAAIAFWCLHAKRPMYAMAVLVLAASVFVSWELFVAHQDGHSHFLLALQQRQEAFFKRIPRLLLPMITNLGGLMPALALLGLAALQWSKRSLYVVAAAMAAGFIALALVPNTWAMWGRSLEGKPIFTLFQSLYGCLGALACAVIVAVVRQRDQTGNVTPCPPRRFLLFWLGAEVAWYFVVTPFPAARRVLGIVIVATLLIARLAGNTCAERPRRSWVWKSAVASALLGILFFVVDWHEARAPHLAARVAARGEYRPAAGGTAWFADLGGFAYAAQRNGLRELVLGRTIPRRGDVIFLPTTPYPIDEFIQPEKDVRLEKIGAISVADRLPLRTALNFYAGSAPLQHHEGPRYVVAVYRVVADFTPDPASR